MKLTFGGKPLEVERAPTQGITMVGEVGVPSSSACPTSGGRGVSFCALFVSNVAIAGAVATSAGCGVRGGATMLAALSEGIFTDPRCWMLPETGLCSCTGVVWRDAALLRLGARALRTLCNVAS